MPNSEPQVGQPQDKPLLHKADALESKHPARPHQIITHPLRLQTCGQPLSGLPIVAFLLLLDGKGNIVERSHLHFEEFLSFLPINY